MSVIYDRQAGYCRELTRSEMAALLAELAALIEVDVVTEGKVPTRQP